MYDIYSKFDIKKHAETFINYLEVCIDPKGNVYYALPSHTMFLENIIKKEIGQIKFKELIDSLDLWCDYHKFLCTYTGYCSVWNNFYQVGEKGLTKEQKCVLEKLQKTYYTKIPNSPLFNGEI